MCRSFALSVVTALAALVAPASALATNYAVTRQDDPSAGMGSCATPGAPCSLRQAVNTANANAGADVITLPAGDYQRNGALGDVDATESLTLAGDGARTTTIRGASSTRGLQIGSAGTYEVRDVTITGGNGVLDGGGIANNTGTLTLRRVALVGNRATANCALPPGFSSAGGGVSSNGALTVVDSLIAGNFADGAACPGGVGAGAGIRVVAPLTVIDSTITGNVAGTGNLGSGGGISENLGSAVAVTLKNATVPGNTAVGGGSGGNILISNSAPTLSLTGSIVSDGSGAAGSENCSLGGAAVTSGGGNVEDRDQCHLGSGDRRSVSPQLGPLQDNGGPTNTRAIPAASPAFDFAGACGLPTDQRGVSRPQGAACDSGAFELALPGDTGGAGGGAGSSGAGTGSSAGGGAGIPPALPKCDLAVAGDTRGLRVRMTCDQAASLTLTGDVTLITRRKHRKARRAATKTVALAPVSGQVVPGTLSTLMMSVPRSVARAVKSGARATAHLRLVATVGGIQSQLTSTSFAIKAPRKKKHRRH
jgi:hypothetical protein